MTAQEVVNCCPWRTDQPRALTPYEWTVVENAIHTGIVDAKGMYSAQTKAMAVALTMAIRAQPNCPSWTHSHFGPAPAVASFAYGCLGSWWGALDYASQQRALSDISYQGLLCSPSPPWSMCPISQRDRLWKPLSKSEYGEQDGIILPGTVPAGACVFVRKRTVYTPLTGNDMVELMKLLGGGVVPPDLAQLVQAGGAVFAERSFIVGWQLKVKPDWSALGSLATMADMLKLLDGMLEEVVLIWAPGQGVSIRSMVTTGTIDPAKLMVLLQHLMPAMIDDILKQLPGWIQQQVPGVLQAIPPAPGMDWGSVLGGIFGALGSGTQQRYMNDPPTPPTTGMRVVDNVAADQDPTPPPGAEALPSAAAVEGMDTEVLLALGAVAFGIFLIWHGSRTRRN